MKQIRPSTLRAHLARNQAADQHPDADLLTAFAENTLLDRERSGILTHLAGCSDCRAIVNTAVSAEADLESELLLEPASARRSLRNPQPQPVAAPSPLAASTPEPRPLRPPIRTWFSGVAVAASLLVMAASTVLFYRSLHPTTARTQTAASAPAPPAAREPQINVATNATPAARRPITSQYAHKRAHSPAAPVVQTEEARVGSAAPVPSAPAATGSSSVSLGDLSLQKAQAAPSPGDDARLQAELREGITSRGITAQAKAAPRSSAPASAAESVQVEAGDFARSLQTTHPAAGFIPAPTPVHARFHITGAGQLERSLQPNIWMPVPIAPDTRLRVVSISGSDVWAGGDHLRLFHSADDGLTWSEVQLPAVADRAHAIIHIRIDSPQHLTVEDDAGSTWGTIDRGATWR